jgi:hypothetical protein
MVAVRSVLRAILAACVLLSAGIVVSGYATYSPTDTAAAGRTGSNSSDRSTIDPPASGVTVVTTGSNRPRSDPTNGSRAEAEIVAYGRNGSVRYYNDTYDRYWDVDPVVSNGTGPMTVEYVASERLGASACGLADGDGTDETDEADDTDEDGTDGNGADGENSVGASDTDGEWGADEGAANEEGASEGEKAGVCARNVIERVNLTTGATTTVYDETAPSAEFAPWNDADRINDSHYVVADRSENRVFVVDTRTGEYTWEWYAASAFPFDSGGYYLEDWTHLNDVEYLADGRIMTSVRNHDQIVFLDPDRPSERAIVGKWTLGADDNRSTLYEPYNPDYVPPENGGPAVLLADAGNDRVVEYSHRKGPWERTWAWRDSTLQWPRDADRLANGHTLIIDSNGDRVLEVDRTGAVVWSVSVGLPYDAERLETGPESAGGPSAESLGLGADGGEGETGDGGETDGDDRGGVGGDPAGSESESTDPLVSAANGLLSGPTPSAVLYASPAWMGAIELLALGAVLLVSLAWLLAESYWRSAFATLRRRAEGPDRR